MSKTSKDKGRYRCSFQRQHHPRRIGRYFREKEALRSPYPLKFQQKRRNGSDCALPFRWRRTWDSNPRGCYTLLDFQSSSLATRSILQIICCSMPDGITKIHSSEKHLTYFTTCRRILQEKNRYFRVFFFKFLKSVAFF